MEIPIIDIKNKENPLEINNKIISLYKSYNIFHYDVKLQNKRVLVSSIRNNDTLLIRGFCIILGAYSPDKNIWVWSDKSVITYKNMNNKVSKIRKKLLKLIDKNINDSILHDRIKQFILSDHIGISTLELCMYLYYIALFINKIIKNISMITSLRPGKMGNYIDVNIFTTISSYNINELTIFGSPV